MTLAKANIIGAVSERTGFTKKKSRHTVNALIEVIKSTLETGENIKLIHFGKFDIKEKKARRWRSPFTGKIMMLPPKRVVTFKSFKRLKDKINAQPVGIEQEELFRAKIRAAPKGVINPDELKKILDDHRRWLDSEGKSGEKAVLICARLVGADLYGTNLTNTDMDGAILTNIKLDYETQLNLPKPVFNKYRQTFRILEWSPALAPSY